MGLKRAETTVGTSKNATKPRRNTVQLGNGFNHIWLSIFLSLHYNITIIY